MKGFCCISLAAAATLFAAGSDVVVCFSEHAGHAKEEAVKWGAVLNDAPVKSIDKAVRSFPNAGFFVPTSTRLSATEFQQLLDVLKSGGKVLFGGVPFAEEWWKGKPLRDSSFARGTFTSPAAMKWRTMQDSGSSQSVARAVSNAVEFICPFVREWANMSADFAPPNIAGPLLLVLEISASTNTTKMMIELEEQDGSHWFARIHIPRGAKKLVMLRPHDFSPIKWKSPPSRGHKKDRVRFHSVRNVAVGLSSDFVVMSRGRHNFVLHRIGWAADPCHLAGALADEVPTLWPRKQCFLDTRVARLIAASHQTLVPGRFTITNAARAWCSPARWRGICARREAPFMRFIPLIEAVDDDGHRAGYAGWITLPYQGKFTGSRLAVLGWHLLPDSKTAILVRNIVSFLNSPCLLSHGGVPSSQRPGESYGPRAWLTSHLPDGWFVRAIDTKCRLQSTNYVDRDLGVCWKEEWRAPSSAAERRLSIQLLDSQSNIVDTLTQLHATIPVAQDAPEEFVTVSNGHFYLKGTRWYAQGVNFWPRYCVGIPYANSWLDSRHYDARLVDEELRCVRESGFNAVAIQPSFADRRREVADVLWRCGKYGLRAFLFVAHGHPTQNPDARKIRDFVVACGITNDATALALDLAWEPRLGSFAQRQWLSNPFERWTVEKYGTLEHAFQKWNYRPAKFAVPTDEQIKNDGSHRAMVADFRRFLDDYITRRYRQIRKAVKVVAPRLLLSARTGYGGNGNAWVDAEIPYDLKWGAGQFDFICPEGYHLAGAWENVRNGAVEVAYVRGTCGGGRPVVWAEFGMSIHNGNDAREQAGHCDLFMRMVSETDSDGAFLWWWPGGWRFDEGSDFGMRGPDGRVRPAGDVLKRWSKRLPSREGAARATVEIPAVLYEHPRGYTWLAEQCRPRVKAALDATNMPVIRAVDKCGHPAF